MFGMSFSGIVRSDMTIDELSKLEGIISGTNFSTLDALAASAENCFGVLPSESITSLEEMAKTEKWAKKRLEERNREVARAKWVVENLPIYQPRAIELEPPILSIRGLVAPNSFFSDEEMKEMRLK